MIDVLTAAIVVANLLLVFFIYKQVRFAHKPIITTKIISREKDVGAKADVLEVGVLYLVVSNVSKNMASNLRIHWEFLLKNKKLAEENKFLKYLNSREAMKEVLRLSKIIEGHPELFDKVQKEDIEMTIPKETLRLLLNITVTCNFPKHKMNDSYNIEWGSLKSYPRFEDHPIVHCWNRRDGLYIYKLGENSAASPPYPHLS